MRFYAGAMAKETKNENCIVKNVKMAPTYYKQY